ncbi:S8 family serine peptidase [Patescibacteria group bacterium]
MQLSEEHKKRFIHIFTIGILPLMILAFLSAGYALVNNILKQGEASNTAVPEYNLDNQIDIEGTELYQNINKDKYGDVDTIEAAKGELLIRLNDNTPLYEIAIIANQYNMDILKRYRKDKPSFRLRLSSVTTEETEPESTQEETTEPSTNINQIQTTTTPETTEPEQDEIIPNPNIPKSDGTLEKMWEELDSNPKIYSVGLNAIEYPDGTIWDGGYWPNDQHMNFPTKPGDKGELKSIGAHKAWKKLQDTMGDSFTGGDHEVWTAVIDTGNDLDHPDIVLATDGNGQSLGKTFVECEEGKYNESCKDWVEFGGTSGGDGIDNDNDGWVDEGSSHGTFVSGIIAEAGDNIDMAAGVAYNTRIVPVNVCDLDGDFGCPRASIIEGVDYATSLNNVKILSISIAGPSSDLDYESVFNDAWGAGKIIVAGAGNTNNDLEQYPAAYDNVIAAAGVVDTDGEKSHWSSYGDWIDISAIIDGIYSTKYDNTYGSYYGDEYEWGGTSWAAPQVSGSVALLLSMYPNLSNEEARDITIQRAHTKYAERGLPLLGCGIVNPGDMVISKAPLIESPDRCITRFTLGEDIKLKWKPFPGTQPTSYRIHYYDSNNGTFPPPEPDDGVDIGDTTSWTVKSGDAEMLVDGTWAWRVGAWFENENKIYWTSVQTVFKHTGAQISNPKDDKIISQGEVFDWESIENATNYVGYIWCDNMPWNPNPKLCPAGVLPGYLISLGSQSQHTLTAEEWNLLQEFAEEEPFDQPIECSWSVAGTRITDKDLWSCLEFSKHQEFLVPQE